MNTLFCWVVGNVPQRVPSLAVELPQHTGKDRLLPRQGPGACVHLHRDAAHVQVDAQGRQLGQGEQWAGRWASREACDQGGPLIGAPFRDLHPLLR